MLEYLEYDCLINNSTGLWSNYSKTDFEEKKSRSEGNYQRTIRMIDMISNVTRHQLTFLQPQIKLQTRKVSLK